ncbi:hypothetical protein [Noviherbaspirillum galbum]|uniref:Uncharacterized protein n=1 Tax=Noviherbaspirillum galbum TaxID=2709383 RepID=A0A6B3SG57_9BURK|nr:hypothetical protein [Noviherbaspirillum galbum]NEX59867.1 hypothetical protein [Noviherbaspirillum galbum]
MRPIITEAARQDLVPLFDAIGDGRYGRRNGTMRHHAGIGNIGLGYRGGRLTGAGRLPPITQLLNADMLARVREKGPFSIEGVKVGAALDTLRQDLSPEYGVFFSLLDTFKRMPSRETAGTIIDTCIRQDSRTRIPRDPAKEPINIGGAMRREIIEQFESSVAAGKPLSRHLFDGAERTLLGMLESDYRGARWQRLEPRYAANLQVRASRALRIRAEVDPGVGYMLTRTRHVRSMTF